MLFKVTEWRDRLVDKVVDALRQEELEEELDGYSISFYKRVPVVVLIGIIIGELLRDVFDWMIKVMLS